MLEVHEITVAKGAAAALAQPPQKLLVLDMPGHRSDPRCLAFSADSGMMATGDSSSLKVWSTETRKCIRSVDDLASGTGSGSEAACVSLSWLPGDRHVCVGTKQGELLLVDLASGRVTFRNPTVGAGPQPPVHPPPTPPIHTPAHLKYEY